jgi:geranylgeranyl diphosphate synthase type II
MDFTRYYEEKKKIVDSCLQGILDQYKKGCPKAFFRTLSYCVFPGGKRVRAVAVLLSADLFGVHARRALAPACAMELLHTYSLIHDDLPAMDDDDLRRGRASCHKKFGEASAILAGDALLTLVFEVLAHAQGIDTATKTALIGHTARQAGALGMVGGQYMDLAAEGKISAVRTQRGKKLYEYINAHKTASLFAASFAMGSIVAKAPLRARANIAKVGQNIGLAFQMLDDAKDKQGFFTLYGMRKTLQGAHRLLDEACRLSRGFKKKDLILGFNQFILRQFNVS